MPVQDMDLIRLVLEYIFSESALTLYIVLEPEANLNWLQFSTCSLVTSFLTNSPQDNADVTKELIPPTLIRILYI